jgi:NAD(P)H dehydrogenase (quinone)
MIKRVPELVPDEVAKKSGTKLDRPTPRATVDELANYVPISVSSRSLSSSSSRTVSR